MPVEELFVRLCAEADLPALHAREVHPSARAAQRHFDRQEAGDYLYAVVLADGQILGTCALDCDRGEPLCPELKSLWVYPEARRRGAGRALTRFLEARAAELGFVEVFLRVDPDNVAAIPMYIGLDYSPTGDHVGTTYESMDDQGQEVSTEQTDAVYRKSLLTR
jgi:ribosomal protein S18 acetylase RimI-like enzyme